MVQQTPGGSAGGVAEGQSLRLSGGAIASLTGVGLLAIFMVQNTEPVTLHFLFWSFTWPLWLLILATALVGALANTDGTDLHRRSVPSPLAGRSGMRR